LEAMKEEMIKLHEQTPEDLDPGSEQLINIFENLNQVEMQIKEMDQIVNIYIDRLGYV
jgi:hypothetical protein